MRIRSHLFTSSMIVRSLVAFLSLTKSNVSAYSPCDHIGRHIRTTSTPLLVSSQAFTSYRLDKDPLCPRSNCRSISKCTVLYMGKPKRGSVVDHYQTVSVNCKKCRTRLFRYKKKNGTKSNLIKCYVERISEDCVDLVAQKERKSEDSSSDEWFCPNCGTRFGKDALIHGRPAIKLVGGKTAMTKK